MNRTQGSPNMFLHRAWVFLLYQSPTPSPPSAWIMWHGLQVTQGLGPEHSMAQMQQPTGPSFPLFLTTIPLRMAGKDLPLRIPHDCNLHPKLGLSPKEGLREWSARWKDGLLPGLACCFQQCPAHKRCTITDE